MGFFKDINNIQKQSKELGRNSPGAGARFAEMNQKMASLTDTLEASTAAASAPSPGSVAAEVQVLSAEPPTSYVNGDPVVRITVLVLMPGVPPVPATQSLIVPALHIHRVSAGTRLAARVDPGNVAAFTPDWSIPS